MLQVHGTAGIPAVCPIRRKDRNYGQWVSHFIWMIVGEFHGEFLYLTIYYKNLKEIPVIWLNMMRKTIAFN